jgi:hypothetical protein
MSREIVDSIAKGDVLALKAAFNESIKLKVKDALDEARADYIQEVFTKDDDKDDKKDDNKSDDTKDSDDGDKSDKDDKKDDKKVPAFLKKD